MLLPNDMQMFTACPLVVSRSGLPPRAMSGSEVLPQPGSELMSMAHRKSSRGPWPALLPEVMLMLVGHAVTGGHTDVSVA